MNKQSKSYYRYLTLLISILFCGLVWAIPVITEWDTNPANNTITSNSSVSFGYNVTCDSPDCEFAWIWDGVRFNLTEGLVLHMNFDNRSALPCGSGFENDTCVADISGMGNNGTIVGNWNASGDVVSSNISWTPNGKYGGAFNFTQNSYISIPDSNSLAYNYTSMTWSFWLYQRNYIANAGWLDKYSTTGNQRSWRIYDNGGGSIGITLSNNGATAGTYTSTGILGCGAVVGSWKMITATYNGTKLIYYSNGVLCDTDDVTIAQIYDNTALVYIGFNSGAPAYFNGSIDDVIIFNRTLNSSEVSQLYLSQITKYDSQNWSFQTNQSLGSLNSTTTSINFPYYLCSSNSSSSENCTSQKIITQTIPNKVLTANFTNSLGTINPVFYGSIYGLGMSQYSSVSNDMSCSLVTPSDYNKERSMFLNGGLKEIRKNMNIELTENEDGTFTTGMRNNRELVEWAYNNGVKLTFIAYGMPDWLANKTTTYCTLNGSNSSCPPDNYTEWGRAVTRWIYNATNGDAYISAIDSVEVWNEPQNNFFLNNLTTDNITKTSFYNDLFNATYNAVTIAYPTIKIIGVGGGNLLAPNLINGFLSNFSYINPLYVSLHDYYGDSDTDFNGIQTNIDYLLGRCNVYGANCSKIYFNEWNLYKSAGVFTSFQGAYIGNNYAYMLNNNSANYYSNFFMWSTIYKNLSCDSEGNYSMYQQSNGGYVPYNVTKSMATRHRSGDTVYQSSSTDSGVKIVSSKSSDNLQHAITVINSNNYSVNVSNLTIYGDTITSFKDTNGNIYPVTAGVVNLGIMDSYQEGGSNNILYLTEDLQAPTITIDSPTSSTYSTTNIDFNITLDEEGDTCIYSLNNFITNYTMAKQGYVNEFKKLVTGLGEGSNGYHNVSFWCNDTSGNSNKTSIYFTINPVPYNPGQGLDTTGVTTVTRNNETINESINLNVYVDYYYKGINVYSFPEFLRNKFDSIKIKTEVENLANFNLKNLAINEMVPIELREYFGNEVYDVNSNSTKYLWESQLIKTSDLNNSNFDLNIKLIGVDDSGNTIFLNKTANIISSVYVEEATTNSAKSKEAFDLLTFLSNNFFMVLIIAVVLIFVVATKWDKRR